MFKRILIATDGSSHATLAVKLAADLATLYHAELIVLHVVPSTRLARDMREQGEGEQLLAPAHAAPSHIAGSAAWLAEAKDGVPLSARDRRMLETVGARILAEAKTEAESTTGKPVRALLEHGDPTGMILDCAARESVDLLVTGSRGLGDAKGLMLGSVSHKVMQRAPCTCITVK